MSSKLLIRAPTAAPYVMYSTTPSSMEDKRGILSLTPEEPGSRKRKLSQDRGVLREFHEERLITSRSLETDTF
jgi:hypothetical protein